MTYFKNITNLTELRKVYKDLVKKHHPDNGGELETIQAINVEFDNLKVKLKDDKEQINEVDYDMFKDIIFKIITFEELEIEICGTWLWVGGNTIDYKKELREAGLYWASKKKKCYWRPSEYKSKSRKAHSMEEIRQKYGSDKIATKKTTRLVG